MKASLEMLRAAQSGMEWARTPDALAYGDDDATARRRAGARAFSCVPEDVCIILARQHIHPYKLVRRGVDALWMDDAKGMRAWMRTVRIHVDHPRWGAVLAPLEDLPKTDNRKGFRHWFRSST